MTVASGSDCLASWPAEAARHFRAVSSQVASSADRLSITARRPPDVRFLDHDRRNVFPAKTPRGEQPGVADPHHAAALLHDEQLILPEQPQRFGDLLYVFLTVLFGVQRVGPERRDRHGSAGATSGYGRETLPSGFPPVKAYRTTTKERHSPAKGTARPDQAGRVGILRSPVRADRGTIPDRAGASTERDATNEPQAE